MEEEKFINKGGIIGSGEGVVNTNSQDYLILRKTIEEASKNRNPVERIEDHLLGIRLRMERYVNSSGNIELKSAGEFLKECLKVVGIKNRLFAAYIGYEESNLSALCHGRRKLTAELAIKLEKILKIPATLWLGIQNKMELARLKEKRL